MPASGWRRRLTGLLVAGTAALSVIAGAVPAARAGLTAAVTTLVNFKNTNGSFPRASLILADDGNFYGTTEFGGANQTGTVFKLTPGGTLTTLHSFAGVDGAGSNADGAYPEAALIQASDRNFYGTTFSGGPESTGTVFQITPAGVFTTLFTFGVIPAPAPPGDVEGGRPMAALVEGSDGLLYGVNSAGGPNNDGTLFSIMPQGPLTVLHAFAGTDGSLPAAALIENTDGSFCGTCVSGGAIGAGTAFSINPDGNVLKILHSFGGVDSLGNPDGAQPKGALVQAADGNYYGTTSGGDTGNGTVFQLTPGGILTNLHSFSSSEGNKPLAGLIQGLDGSLFGTTSTGGSGGGGTIFRITTAGVLTTLHSFDSTVEGYQPEAALLQISDGTFYGTNTAGGSGNGSAFTFTLVVSPSVTSATTASAVAGQAFNYRITADQTGVTFAATGLPAGLSLAAGTGLISGTPTTPGTYTITLRATNSSGTGTATLTLTVAAAPPVVVAPVITSATTASAQVGAAFAYQITATNTPVSYAATGLPAGLSISATTGLISGTVSGAAGTFPVTLAATNTGGTGTAVLTLTVAPASALPSTPVPVITLAAAVPQVTAGTGEIGEFLLVRTGDDLSTELFVHYTVKGSAVGGVDYIALKGTKKVKPGKANVRIKVSPLGEGAGPGVKRVVTLLLAPGDGYTVGLPAKAKVKIFGQ